MSSSVFASGSDKFQILILFAYQDMGNFFFFFLQLQLYFWIIANICFRDKSVYFYIFNSVIGIFLLFSSKKFKKSYNEDRIVRSFPLNSKDTCLFYCTYLRQFVQKITVSQGCKVRRLFMDIEHYCGVIFEKNLGTCHVVVDCSETPNPNF